MDFEFTDTQLAVRDLAQEVLAKRAPKPGFVDSSWPDAALWEDLTQTGLLAAFLSEDVGGQGFDFVEVCLLLEECGAAHARAPVATTILGSILLDRFAPEVLRQAWLPKVARGEAVLTVAAMDALGGDGPLDLKARPDGGGGFVVSGRQRFASWGETTTGIVIFAHVDDGLVCLLADPLATGVKLEPLATTSGAPEVDLCFSRVQIGAADVIAEPADGAAIRAWIWQRAVVAASAALTGAAAAALQLTAEYTSSRHQFGRPIGSFQAVAMHAANAFIDVEAMRLAMLQAAWRLSVGLPAAREVSIAKLWASEGATRVLATAHHLHGGAGLLLDYPLHLYLTMAKHLSLSAGSAQWHLARLGDIAAASATAEVS